MTHSFFLVMAGPNGAGKSTCARHFVPEGAPYINADEIAKDLAPVVTSDVNVQAARLAIEEMDRLELRRESFAVETTLASKTLASRASRLRKLGYRFELFYLWTPDADYSIDRVARRVRLGGHDIPTVTIRRRWLAGLKNFFAIYQPIADAWTVVDNMTSSVPLLIARGRFDEVDEVIDPELWNIMKRRVADAT